MQMHEARPILNGFLLVKVCIPLADFQNMSLKNAYFFWVMKIICLDALNIFFKVKYMYVIGSSCCFLIFPCCLNHMILILQTQAF